MPIEPLYLQIYADIVRRIESGEYPPRSELPTGKQLEAQYEASNTAVRMALLLLKERGYVEGQQGKRVYVRERGTDAEG